MHTPDTFILQEKLVQYCRTGENAPETSKPENTHHYRRLVYNVVRDTIKKANPKFVELFGKEKFEEAVHYFYSNHKCKTPQVWKLPFEFYQFYSENPLPFEHHYPFIAEMLLFEWVEVEIFMMEDEEVIPYLQEGNSETDYLVSNPEIRIIPLNFPIHLKNIKEISESDRGQFFVIFVRHPETKKVKYFDISFPTAEMLVKINDEPTKFEDVVNLMSKYESAKENQLNRAKKLFDFALKNQMILGYTPTLNVKEE